MYQDWEKEAAEEAYSNLMEYEEDQSHIVKTRELVQWAFLLNMIRDIKFQSMKRTERTVKC